MLIDFVKKNSVEIAKSIEKMIDKIGGTLELIFSR